MKTRIIGLSKILIRIKLFIVTGLIIFTSSTYAHLAFESGTISITQNNVDDWTTVPFSEDFEGEAPIVVVGPSSYQGDDPHVIRVKDVTPLGFKVQIQEWRYLDGTHPNTEDISYLAMKEGVHNLGSLKVNALRKTAVDHNTSSIDFDESFASTPIVFSQITTFNGGQPATLRTENIDLNGFDIRTQEEEAGDNTHNPEHVDIIAIEAGSTTFRSHRIIVATLTGVDEGWETANFGETLSSNSPHILAAMQTTAGTDTATLRYKDLSNSSVKLMVQEETSNDDETGHADEDVGYIVIQPN